MTGDVQKETEKLNRNLSDFRFIINGITVLMLLMLIYPFPDGRLYTITDAFLTKTFRENGQELLYLSLCDVYDMFSYVLSFFLPLWLLLLLCKSKLLRPDIPFTPSLPENSISAVFAVIGVLFASGNITEYFLLGLEKYGIFVSLYDTAVPETGGRILLYFLASVILPAFVEEMIFRGYILHCLLPYGKTVAVLVSGILFGIMHLYVPQMLYATVSGILIGYFVVKNGSVWIGIFIHIVNNLLSFVSDMAWTFLDEDGYYLFSVIFQGVIYLLAVLAVIRLFYHSSSFGYFSLSHPAASAQDTETRYTKRLEKQTAMRAVFTVPMMLYLFFAWGYTVWNSFLI